MVVYYKVGPLLYSCKWSYNPYKWPYKWVAGVIALLMGLITTVIVGGATGLSSLPSSLELLSESGMSAATK